MHTPEALAKHYISYNAKVGETISLLLLSVKKEKEKFFCFSTMLKRMSILEQNNNAFAPSLRSLYLYLYRKKFQKICGVKIKILDRRSTLFSKKIEFYFSSWSVFHFSSFIHKLCSRGKQK